MNILFLTISQIESIDDAGLYEDLLRQFRNAGHTIYVVSPIERRHKEKTSYSVQDGVHYIRVKIGNVTQTGLLEKGLSTLLIEQLYTRAIDKFIDMIRFHVILYATPPITFEKLIRKLKIQHHAKSYLLLKDIFPQNAVDLQMLKKDSFIYRYFRHKEKRLYAISDVIGCMSPANEHYIEHHNPTIPPQIIKLCPNSIEPKYLSLSSEQKQQIRLNYNIPLQKTIYIYGGNLGKPQAIPFMLQCLHALQHEPNAFFVIVGAGTQYDAISNFIYVNKLPNVILIRQLPKPLFRELVASCDVGLLFLDARFTIPNVPSRLLSYLEAGLPILAATDNATDIGQIIVEGGFGVSCDSVHVEHFTEHVQRLLDPQLRQQMGVLGKQYLEQHFSANKTYKTIMSHLNER